MCNIPLANQKPCDREPEFWVMTNTLFKNACGNWYQPYKLTCARHVRAAITAIAALNSSDEARASEKGHVTGVTVKTYMRKPHDAHAGRMVGHWG